MQRRACHTLLLQHLVLMLTALRHYGEAGGGDSAGCVTLCNGLNSTMRQGKAYPPHSGSSPAQLTIVIQAPGEDPAVCRQGCRVVAARHYSGEPDLSCGVACASELCTNTVSGQTSCKLMLCAAGA